MMEDMPPCLLLVLSLFALTVSGQASPRRIVSLTPGITEMLFALGLGRQVVGDTNYCDYPPAARSKTKIGDVRVNYERVVALRPDLVVGDAVATSAADARLSRLQLNVLTIRPDSVDGVERSLRQIGQATGTMHQANAEIARMEAQRKAARVFVSQAAHRPAVLIVVGTNPLYVAGRGTFLADIVTEAGGDDTAALSGYGVLSKESVLAHPPDVILAPPADQAALCNDPVLRFLPAVRAGHFVYVTDKDLIERPGPRVTEGLLQVARALHPRAR